MKILFFFGGTGCVAADDCTFLERFQGYDKDVLRIYLDGCQAPTVGNGTIFPNLDIVAARIQQTFSRTESGVFFNLEEFKRCFTSKNGAEAFKIKSDKALSNGSIQVDDICLAGFSRGAVTTFAVTQKLDQFDVPIHIFANQPVPGEYSLQKTAPYATLAQCQNIASATVIVASHNRENGMLHDYFFKQMIPEFPTDCQSLNIFELPYQHHLDWYEDRDLLEYHFWYALSKNGYMRNGITLGPPQSFIKNGYKHNSDYCFTPEYYKQKTHTKNSRVQKDFLYFEVMRQELLKIIESADISNKVKSLGNERIQALYKINKLYSREYPDLYQQLFNFILDENETNRDKVKKFVEIVNLVAEVSDYLSVRTRYRSKSYILSRYFSRFFSLFGEVDWRPKETKKSQLIAKHAIPYQIEVITSTYQFLSLPEPTQIDHKTFAKHVRAAEEKFQKNALLTERGYVRQLLKFVSDIITFTTGDGLFSRNLPKSQTKLPAINWFYFRPNRSTQMVAEMRKTVFNKLGFKQ